MIGITVLAGTQEAARQFDGLKSSLKNFTRASLWSGLIVYAQPVNDGKLPTPQIYYLMPAPQQQQPAAPAAQQPLLADNANGATTTNKPGAGNNHVEEALAVAELNPEASALTAAREAEDAAKAELSRNKLPLNLIASHLAAPKAAPKPDRVRVFEEVARHEAPALRKLGREADKIVKVFVKELDAAKLAAEADRLMAEHGRLERWHTKTNGEAEVWHRRVESRVVRRAAARPERPEHFRVIVPFAGTRGIALPEMSSIGCEKTRTKPEAPPAAPVAKRNARHQAAGEPPAVELSVPDAPHPAGNTWTLNCDTEPEQK
ncbi:MAG TPA: hypothetical protein VEX70_08290 [Pyrinomonadaceae bacterium]|nr:hypothetical protein [Pyrinomonadaceae bacterium]